MKERGISLIALIITIIVIIILAAISIAGVSGVVERSRYAKFCGDLDAVQDAVSQAYGNELVNQALKNPTNRKSSEEIYSIVAGGSPKEDNQDLVEIADGNKLGIKLPKYGDSKWYVDVSSGEVYLLDGFEYNGKLYSSKADIQKGEGRDPNTSVETYEKFHEVIQVDVPSGAIPVIYDQEQKAWKRADTSTHWYDYRESEKQWANVVTVGTGKSYAVDDIIPEGDILGMFVYIPRYAYKIKNGYHSNVTGNIEIVFINQSNQDKDGKTYTYVTTYPGAENGAMKDYVVHPVFTGDSSIGGWENSLNGFWIAKFKAGGDMENITFKPNMNGISKVDISTIVVASKQIAKDQNVTSSNTHLLKNSEWGAIAYLTQSKYGNTEIVKDSGTVTGMVGSNAYHTTNGQKSSSTGNVYGVYDLTGGTFEYVAAYVKNNYGTSYKGSFSSATPYLQNEYTIGKEDETSANYEANKNKWGDAIWETSNCVDEDRNCWKEGFFFFPAVGAPFFLRGGSMRGLFSFYDHPGDGNFALRFAGFRIALVTE